LHISKEFTTSTTLSQDNLSSISNHDSATIDGGKTPLALACLAFDNIYSPELIKEFRFNQALPRYRE